ncbi:hypothetical protein [Pontivivens ytuae]|uniref:Uncharacterized protein n=1 Tax=Pontivivens ytuae TaxID=2789856 RepID=A0A7S9QCY7_9RHOB|nr:hypothetical protein [Pontivivens ytuae]QPH54428.1 hypothetical protein I0K15_01195 [Pontivivens ytuae]
MIRALALAALLPATAQAQAVVTACDVEWASAANVADPVESSFAYFANGEVRLLLLDTIEPALGYNHILLQWPDDTLPGGRCRVISAVEGGGGFAGVDFAALSARYDPLVGLVIEVPVNTADAPEVTPRILTISLDRLTDRVSAE